MKHAAKIFRVLVTANVVPSSFILFTLKEGIRPSETPVLKSGIAFKKTTFFIVTAVKASNLTTLIPCLCGPYE
jgi:hypothetical protein